MESVRQQQHQLAAAGAAVDDDDDDDVAGAILVFHETRVQSVSTRLQDVGRSARASRGPRRREPLHVHDV